jgi:hypothetical protein
MIYLASVIAYANHVKLLKFTPYFVNEVMRKRPYVTKELVQSVVDNPIKSQSQPNGRVRYWAKIEALGGRYLRVVLLEDKETVLNAFLDRDFKL